MPDSKKNKSTNSDRQNENAHATSPAQRIAELEQELNQTQDQLKTTTKELATLKLQRQEAFTERNRIEQELIASQDRLREIADATDYVFWITCRAPERVLYVSPAFEKIWGRSVEDLLEDSRLWTNPIHPDDVAHVHQAFERWIGDPQREGFDVEYRIVRPDGNIRWIADHGSAIHEENGLVNRVVGIARDITESRLALRRIEETESRLRAFLDNAPVMMGLVELPDDNSDVLHVLDNVASEKFYGVGPGDTLGKWSLAELGSTSEKRDQWVTNYRKAQESGTPISFFYSYVVDNQDRWLHVTVSHLGIGSENRERFCYVAVDDTQRFQAEKELEYSHSTFASLVQDAPFGLYVVDNELKIQHASRGTDKAFENVQPVVGRDLSEVLNVLWTKEFADFAVDKFKQTLETGDSFETTETTEYRGDIGTLESYHWQLQRVRLSNNQLGVACYFYDLTPTRRAEFALRESEGRLRLALELAQMGVITCDYEKDSALLDANAAKMFELPPDQPLTREKLHSVFHRDDRKWLLKKIEEVCGGVDNGVMSVEHRIQRPDGTVVWLDVCKRIYFKEETESAARIPTHAVAAVIDITHRKNYEAEMEAARAQAEAANRARGEFLANMSHEIRTPMTAILGYADMLGEYLTDPDNKQCVETIRRNGRFLLNIINDILDLSKIDAGKMELDIKRIPPQTIMADVVSLMNVRAEEKKIELVAEFDSAVPKEIETDGKRVRQVLLNLIGNAIKFTSEGSVRLTARFNDDTDKFEFRVMDTGIGIQSEDLKKLFKPFTQLDGSNTRSFGGTGLGLAISRRLTQMLGGDICAESKLGEGSSFTVTLDPGSVANVPFVVPSIDVEEETDAEVAVLLSGRYLIVDDRREIRFLAQNFIEAAGGKVETASNGREGVEKVVQAKNDGQMFHVVVMDMQMPVMDGYSATAEIRGCEIDVPIIALTANAMSEDRDKCIAAGCTDFLTKPIDKADLLKTVEKHCRKNSISN